MPEGFRSLAQTLLADRRPVPPQPDPPADDAPQEPRETAADAQDAARAARLFHASVAESVEAAVERLLGDIAADVLARELALQPADLGAIVDRALRRFSAEEPLRVRVHADDLARVNGALPAIADPGLRPGDALIELRDGCIDASLGVRLETVLRAVCG